MAKNMFESLGNNTSETDQTEINCCGKVVAVFICQKCYQVVHGIRVKEIDGPFLGCCESNKSRYENGIPNVMELVKRTLLSALSRKKIQQEPEINPVTDESEKTKELKKELVKGKNRSVEDDTSVQADDASISADDASTEGDDMLWKGDEFSQNKKSSPGPKRDLGEKQSIENKVVYQRTMISDKVNIIEDESQKRPLLPNSKDSIFNRTLEKKNIKKKKVFNCEVCSKTFARKYSLAYHLRTHRGEKPFQCQFCAKLFTDRSTLHKHERLHTGSKPYQCEICWKTFIQSSNLKYHERSHVRIKQKRFQCNVCSKSFAYQDDLRRHKRVHTLKTLEKTFSCRICPKSFTHQSALNIHLRSHTGERPFECKCCSKSFSSRYHLGIHEKTHTGEKLFSCKFCSKKFLYNSGRVKHERIHTDEKPFVCQFCSRGFNDKTTFRRHESIHRRKKASS